ncbi:MAG: hypothetical protein RIM99_11770 [Cyclobacteriaceae bacterium]
MKRIYRLLTIVALSFAGFNANAQVDFSSFLEGNEGDYNELMKRYMEPAFLGFGYGLNSGWYNTAKPHKLLGFDITPTLTMAFVPTKNQFFTINDADFQSFNLNPNSPTNQAPTLFGPNLPADELPLLDYTNNGNTVSLSTPTGLGLKEGDVPFNAVPTGMVQVGVGLFKNTEMKLRVIPTQVFKDNGDKVAEFGMFGIGFMHDLKQWVPGFKQLPLDVSGFVGWNKINTKFFLDPNNPDQVAEFNTSGFTLQGLVSKQLSILTVFGGVGIATTKTDFTLKGSYDTEGGTLVNPVNFDFASGGPRINLGFRLKLLILTLHADYAIQKYSTLTLGVGLSVR